jgi:hypothetical protein
MATHLKRLEPSISEHDIMRLWEEALGYELDTSKERVSPESFSIAVLKN